MRISFLVILIFLNLFLCATLSAQQIAIPTYCNPKDSVDAIKKHELKLALLKKAIAATPTSPDVYADLVQYFYSKKMFQSAFNTAIEASKKCRNGEQLFAQAIIKSALANYDTHNASVWINKVGPKFQDYHKYQSQLDFLSKNQINKSYDTIKPLSIRINSLGLETYPFITSDLKKLYYTHKSSRGDENIHSAIWDSCDNDYIAQGPLPYPITTHMNDASVSVSADGHYLFMMRCDHKSQHGWDDGECDILLSYTADSLWSIPQSFGGTINSPNFEGTPSLSPDNKVLYFSANREGGYGGLDIWRSRFEWGKWQLPENLGPEINTPGDEVAPFIHADGEHLYFVSDGHPGYGGFDIFMSKKNDQDQWTKPQNLGYPINSSSNENSIMVSVDGSLALLSSERLFNEGNYDIFKTQLSKKFQPSKISYVAGFVFDSIKNERLPLSQIFVRELGEETILQQVTTNRGDASYTLFLPKDKNYELQVLKRGFEYHYDTVWSAHWDTSSTIEFAHALLPEDYTPPVFERLNKTFHYPINVKVMDDESKNYLSQYFVEVDTAKLYQVYIYSYTDNSGNPMLNEQISAERAQLLKDFLMSMGFPSDKITAYGFGEDKPIADNNTEEGRNLNRRVEVQVLGH